MLVSIPLVGASMTVDNLSVARGIEVAMTLSARSHGSWRLTALVGSEGT